MQWCWLLVTLPRTNCCISSRARSRYTGWGTASLPGASSTRSGKPSSSPASCREERMTATSDESKEALKEKLLGEIRARRGFTLPVHELMARSEERRVGKECRSRRWPEDRKKKSKKYDV